MIRTHSVRRPRRGFTLVELLVVTLILSILMAVALPLYLSAVKDSRVKTNRANMQTIANAVQAAYVKDPVANAYTSKTIADGTLPDLPTAPKGPSNEVYKITAPAPDGGAFVVSCEPDPDAAGTFEPGKDNK